MGISKKRVFNFSPGPAVLPNYVLDHVAEDIYDFRGTGIGIMELSHRSKEFGKVLEETEALLRELLLIPAKFKVLFITGGGTNQFAMIPMNLMTPGTQANYIPSGFWANRATNEAKKFAPVHVAAPAEFLQSRSVPTEFTFSPSPAYIHYTSNNTIEGTQFHFIPRCPKDVPLLSDASSDFLSKPIPVSDYGMIYAAAQKNAGTSGVTLVILREDLLERSPADLPLMMSYKIYSENRSLYNTAPTFSIYVTMRTLEWIKMEGGVREMEKRAQARAELLYDCLERHDSFLPYATPESRSLMNITFHLREAERTEEFIKGAEKRGLSTIAGYRTVGGLRVSLYNAMPLAGVQALVEYMNEFARK